ncbi:hypothetical protein [Humisphaera borealis]|uniref:DUF883 domain-containing protein n=1 Tax=Humisphaera borealis TaxID=2807512 RepID=A0A7M2WXI7_9BACT|nr:hypothetical protein [Humisphaera borealis]QOV90064.1 hypothetical protein IPV69_01435 [Humisphaera borealis]
MSSSSVRDVIDKARDPAANAVADIRDRAGHLRDDMAEHGREAAGYLRDAARSARKTAGKVGDEVAHGYDVARDYTTRRAQEAMSLVHKHPAAAIAIAAGLGVLIGGLLLARRSHR